jgi:2,3-diketo-5-methylthiopentyl-1-phosphate enolase
MPAVTSDDSSSADRLVATYRFVMSEVRDLRPEAASFATGQSVGTWVAMAQIDDAMVRRFGATVMSATEPAPLGSESAARWYSDVAISFPIDNFSPGFPMLWTTVLGNDPSTGISATLVDLSLPPRLVAAFPGPRMGIEGWRERLQAWGRPLIMNPIKPNLGLAPSVTAEIAADVARGGVDIIKDDEVLGDAAHSHIVARIRHIRKALDAVARDTGHRAQYIVSVTDRQRVMATHVRAAIREGADGVMIAVLGVGLDGLQAVVEQVDGTIPVLAHTAGIDVWGGRDGLGLAPDLLVGRLCRLAGADGVLIGFPHARRPTPRAEWERMAERLRAPWQGVRASFPVVGGGVTVDQVPAISAALGQDVIITAGGAINGHPDGSEAGARLFRRAVDELAGA